MLELRPTCEHCNRPLPADSPDARICSFECTFCKDCVDTLLGDICPNCAGGFAARPIRPATNWRGDISLQKFPASTRVVHQPVDTAVHAALRARIGVLPPERR
jgi:hypothetical protein